jgi:hypothetical protein
MASKRNLAVVVVMLLDDSVQVPPTPPGPEVQLNVLPLAMLCSMNVRPESAALEMEPTISAVFVGSSYCRVKFSIRHDWNRFELSAQAALAARLAGSWWVSTLTLSAFVRHRSALFASSLLHSVSKATLPVAMRIELFDRRC